jgi:hypothetical protein
MIISKNKRKVFLWISIILPIINCNKNCSFQICPSNTDVICRCLDEGHHPDHRGCSTNGLCEDGGGTSPQKCNFGSDCSDCGPRGVCQTPGYIKPNPMCANFDEKGTEFKCIDPLRTVTEIVPLARCSNVTCEIKDCCYNPIVNSEPSPSRLAFLSPSPSPSPTPTKSSPDQPSSALSPALTQVFSPTPSSKSLNSDPIPPSNIFPSTPSSVRSLSPTTLPTKKSKSNATQSTIHTRADEEMSKDVDNSMKESNERREQKSMVGLIVAAVVGTILLIIIVIVVFQKKKYNWHKLEGTHDVMVTEMSPMFTRRHSSVVVNENEDYL